MRTWTHFEEERRRWPLGPWELEPDTALWQEETRGLFCLINRNNLGGLCGYAGYGEHPFHGVDAEAMDAHVTVYGGLTYAGRLEHAVEQSEGEIPDLWWFGFDCMHLEDTSPGMMMVEEMLPGFKGHPDWQVYRDFSWVAAEAESLAHQLLALSDNSDCSLLFG